MKLSEVMKQELDQLKNDAEALLAENKVQEAENKTLEIKILKAKIEIQEKLDDANDKIENLSNQITAKDETISNLAADLEKVNNEKSDAMNKFNEATEKIADLSSQVTVMSPIVDKYNEDKYNETLNNAKEDYKAKFTKCNAVDTFESEEIQNLIVETINEDEVVATRAKYTLSEKLLNALDSKNNDGISITNIQEPAKQTKNLNPSNDEFEAMYGFKRQ